MSPTLLQFVAVATVSVLVAGTSKMDLDTCVVGDQQCPYGDSLVQKTHSVKLSKDTAVKEEVYLRESATRNVRQMQVPFELPPVSTTMKCVISVTVQFFLVWTTLAIVTCLPVICGESEALSRFKAILDDACATVKFAPMISVLMIATRMRALMVTNNKPEKYGLPPDWCKNGMVVCASCVGVITIATMLQRCACGGSGLEALMAVQYIAMIAMYVGFAVVSFGLYSMDTPQELGGSVPISTTANCVMGLTVLYFVVQILRQLSATADTLESEGEKAAAGTGTDKKSTFTKTAEAALKALDYAPMVCILFLAARMRSLQLGLDAPQLWARIYFSITYYSIIVYMVLSAAKVMLQAHKATITCLETLALLILYVSIACVLVSIFTIEPPSGPTPPISTTVRCVMMFTAQYFIIYILEFAFTQLHELGFLESRFLADMFKRTQETVMFCPMLACLFVATRMQALQMTDNKGAPQGWVQDCMMLTQWAVVIQLIMVIIEHCSGKEGGGDAISAVVRNICLFLLHGGVIGVIKGIFEMRPANADGTGQLIPGFVIPGRLSV